MDGVLYLNIGNKHLCHLAVSLLSLRDHYDGEICVLSGDDWFDNILMNEPRLQPLTVKRFVYENRGAYHAKTSMGMLSPFDRTVFLDSDTLVVGDLSEMYPTNDEVRWTQFSTWTTSGKKIRGRITGGCWPQVFPEAVAYQSAMAYPAINTGVVGFCDGAYRTMQQWNAKTSEHESLYGKRSFISDEICAQLLAFDYPHRIMPDDYNASPSYRGPQRADGVKIWHGHGFKFLKRRNGELEQPWKLRCEIWLPYFRRALQLGWCSIDKWHENKSVSGPKHPMYFITKDML